MTSARLSGLSPMPLDRRKVLSLLLIPSYIVLCAVLYLLGGTVAFTDPITLLLLNTAFLGLIPLYVAYVSFVSFRRSGLASVLMMGAGMLFFGLGSIAAGLAGFLPDSTNLSVTVFNLGASAGAALQFGGALTALAGWREGRTERRSAVAATAYAGVIIIFAGIVAAAFLALTPVFFVPGTGSTVVRDFVLATAIEFFLLASVLFFVLYRRRREDFFFWYAVAMAIIGLGLFAATFIVVFGGTFNWAVRAGQYLGAAYILIAFLALQRRASSGNVPVREMLARFFGEAEAGYRQLVETAADAIVVFDPADRILLWNAAAERIFGYTRDEAVGMSFPHLILDDGDRSSLEETAGAARELEARRRDGSRVPVELTVTRRDVAGEAITTCIIRDLTERKQADEALHASEARFRAFMDNSPAIAWMKDEEGRYVYLNRTYRDRFGDPPVERIGKTDTELWPPEVARQFQENDRAVLTSGQPAQVIEETPNTDGGLTFWLDSKFPLQDASGRRFVGGIGIDITERRAAEEALRTYAGDLRRSNEDLERFAYVSSHDLQEPLRAIVSFSQLLERRYRGRLDADADEYIAFIVEGGTRMQTLIQDLLAYSRVNTTKQELTRTDTADVLAAVERSLDLQLSEAGAVITHDPMPVVMADPLQLEQVLTNLVSNAIKFRRPDEPLLIRVGARRIDGFWEFAVADNGIGIEEEYFDRIFVIFQRLHTRETYPGTGVGLAIVKRIVDRHGGSIRVESTPGAGSTFFFTLPAA